MRLLDIISYSYGIFFVALQSAVILGIFLEWRRDRRALATRPGASGERKVSIIIPARDEERRIPGLLESLLEQDINAQVIFVDDGSLDETPAMLADFARKARERGSLDCRILRLDENPGPNRKQRALSAGIAEAGGDLLLFTDADCELPPGWARAMAERMNDEKIGALIGPVFKKKPGRGFFFLFQCYDHAIRYNYLAGSTGLGAAGGGFGNNLAVSRAALDAVGGYDAVPASPTEDAALVSLLRSKGYKVRAAATGDVAVQTCAERTWRAFVGQTLRWNNGGLFSPEPVTRFCYNLLMLLIAAGALAVPLLPFFPGLWPLPAAGLVVMIQNTAAAFAFFGKSLPKGGPARLGYLPALLFAQAYFTLLTLMGYLGAKARWKGKKVG